MTRSLAPRARIRPQPKRTPPDPTAVLHFRCERCDRLVWAHGLATECLNCIDHAVTTFGLGPIQGQVSGT